MKQKLNGWQRLWLLFCGLWLIAAGIGTAFILPNGIQESQKRVLDSIQMVSSHEVEIQILTEVGFSMSEIEEYLAKVGKFDEVRLAKNRDRIKESAANIRTKHYADLTDEEVINHLHTKYPKYVDFTQIETRYSKSMANLDAERIRIILYAFLVWLGTCLFLYGFGFSVGWIIRGFRK